MRDVERQIGVFIRADAYARESEDEPVTSRTEFYLDIRAILAREEDFDDVVLP
jgi:hypothetical protein